MTKEELEIQDKREEFLFIQKNSIEKAKRESREEGFEEGRQKEREALIIKAYRNGTPTNIIGDFVDMSEEDIIEFLEGVDDL